MRVRPAFILPVLTLALFAPAGPAQEPEAAPGNPLAPLARLVGGRWAIEGSYQEFSWGAGRQSIIGRSYFEIDGEARLVSEGSWYWHPGDRTIKGTFTATGMPVVLFEYTTRFEGDVMVSDLRSWDAGGTLYEYRETWEFTGEDRYEWTLFKNTADGPHREMSATYIRQ